MSPIVNNHRKTLISLAILLVIVALAFFIYSTLRFHIVSTVPSTNNFPTEMTYFDINFNQELSNRGFAVSSSPKIIDSYSVSGKSIKIALISQPLNTKTTYTVTIVYVASTSGSHLSNKTFVFRPKVIPFSKLPKNVQQALLQPQVKYDQTVEDNPLLSKLPFNGPGESYSITYNLQNNAVVIDITAPSQQMQQYALSWIEQQGVNINSLNIQYITAQVQP
jgi:hypothetical protein